MSNFHTSTLEKKREKALQLQKEQEKALQQDKKRTFHFFYALGFGVCIFVVSLGAKIVFKPANASMWAIGGLVIFFSALSFSSHQGCWIKSFKNVWRHDCRYFHFFIFA